MNQVSAELITIGDEILYGQILDTNSQWMSRALDHIGVRVVQRTTIGDNESDILTALQQAKAKADIVLITGGLGPTNDDLTKPCLAKFFGVDLVFNEQALEDVSSFFDRRGLQLTDTNRDQALLPANCEMISNTLGTAPGMWFDEENTVYVSMPGVPFEMKQMMTKSILPRIRKRFKTPVIYHKVVKTTGIGESWLADKLKDWEKNLPDHIKLAYLPSLMEVKLRLTAVGDSRKVLEKDVQAIIDLLRPLAGKYIYGFDTDTIENAVGHLLRERNLTISTAESCTGGYLSHLITSVAGSSDYFMGGAVTYSDKIKTDLLDIDPKTLSRFGAVSEEVVVKMAEEVRRKFGSDIGVSTSGVAGPGGGTEEKPVGTVWIAVSSKEGTKARKVNLAKDRELNIQASAKIALNMVRRRLTEND